MGGLIPAENIAHMIHAMRGHKVMLNSDLAPLYGVTTKRLNEQFRRNKARFPEDFAFSLTQQELLILRSQIATSSLWGGARSARVRRSRRPS